MWKRREPWKLTPEGLCNCEICLELIVFLDLVAEYKKGKIDKEKFILERKNLYKKSKYLEIDDMWFNKMKKIVNK